MVFHSPPCSSLDTWKALLAGRKSQFVCVGPSKLWLPDGEEMGEDQAALLEGLWKFICVQLASQITRSVVIGTGAVPGDGETLRVVVVETILKYVFKDNSTAEKT